MEALRPPPTLLAITAALILGIFTAYTLRCQPTEQAQNTVAIKPAQPVDHVAIEWIRKYNLALSEADAQDMYICIERTIERYRADPTYQRGAALQVTPRLVLCLILRESRCDPQTLGSSGEIGLTQVYPKHHIKALKSAGIIQDKNDLWQVEANVEAGIYILMNYAKRAKTIEQALSFYNAGVSGEKAGRGYAQKVMSLLMKIEGQGKELGGAWLGGARPGAA